MNYLWFALIIMVCYLIGNINMARIIAKFFKHDDITSKGSGNPGTMNMLRVYGIGPAILTLVLEVLKSGVPALVCGYIMGSQGLFEVAYFTAGVSVVLGSMFPVFYKFKGGKGVACIAGMFFFSPLWYVAIILLLVWTIFLYFVDYAFIATLSFVFCNTIAWAIYLSVLQPLYWWVAMLLIIFTFTLTLILHHANFGRLFKGIEHHTGFSEKVKKAFRKKETIVQMKEKPEKEIVIEDESEQNSEERKGSDKKE